MARSPRRGAVTFVAALLLMLAFATQASAATFDVNTTADTSDVSTGDAICADVDGKCSLRAAVEESNDNEGGDTINLPAGRYVFGEQSEAFEVDGVLNLVGAGAPDTIIDSDGWDSAFFVAPNSTFTGSGFTVTGGIPCECDGVGGAFQVALATLDLTDVRLTRNEVAEGPGGAIGGLGGAIKLTRVRADHNSAEFGGGAIWALASELEITDSTFDGNSAQGDGGAINTGFPECDCAGPPEGLTFLQRKADLAAPLEKPGQLVISGSTLNDNVTGSRGGAIYNQPLAGEVIVAATGAPAPVDEDDPAPAVQRIENSTISGNTAGADRGGCIGPFGCSLPNGAGGGIYNENGGDGGGTLDLVSDTIAENHVVIGYSDGPTGGGNIATSGIVNLRNTIIADGTVIGEHNNCISFHEGYRFVSQGNNLETADSDGLIRGCNLDQPSDKPHTDPKLGPLADNGGPTRTHALRDGSPAIDAGSNDAGPALDQRGGDRPPAGGSAGDTRDIGAYEAYSLADLSVESKGASATGTVGQPLTYTLVVRNSGPDKVNGVTLADALPGGLELVSADGCTGGVSCALGTVAAGDVKVVTVVVRPTAVGTLSNTATVSAAGITDTKPANDSASATTQVGPAPAAPAAPAAPQQQPGQQQEQDKDVTVNLQVPKTVTIDQFMSGILVEADCNDEACLRRLREHAAINTGASHIAGFNLTVSRGSLGLSSKKTKFRLKPCQSGSKNGRRHRRCMTNLRKAANKAKKFRVKVVVSAVDAAGNKDYAKGFVTVGG